MKTDINISIDINQLPMGEKKFHDFRQDPVSSTTS